ncbi:hypothetical protein QQX98_006942 [Neonectria punicea]|uniref:Fork-head domain-containing protein n=1 Tax=Neonectria punicea TaxID=979145 RepID=A0ABR1GZD8_9HYPO
MRFDTLPELRVHLDTTAECHKATPPKATLIVRELLKGPMTLECLITAVIKRTGLRGRKKSAHKREMDQLLNRNAGEIYQCSDGLWRLEDKFGNRLREHLRFLGYGELQQPQHPQESPESQEPQEPQEPQQLVWAPPEQFSQHSEHPPPQVSQPQQLFWFPPGQCSQDLPQNPLPQVSQRPKEPRSQQQFRLPRPQPSRYPQQRYCLSRLQRLQLTEQTIEQTQKRLQKRNPELRLPSINTFLNQSSLELHQIQSFARTISCACDELCVFQLEPTIGPENAVRVAPTLATEPKLAAIEARPPVENALGDKYSIGRSNEVRRKAMLQIKAGNKTPAIPPGSTVVLHPVFELEQTPSPGIANSEVSDAAAKSNAAEGYEGAEPGSTSELQPILGLQQTGEPKTPEPEYTNGNILKEKGSAWYSDIVYNNPSSEEYRALNVVSRAAGHRTCDS